MQKHPWYLMIMVFAFIVTGLVSEAYAKSSYLTSFNTTYPTAPTTIKNCTLCHPNGTTSQLNGYASAYKSAAYNYKSIEALDSDADGFTNIAEINAGTYPGLATSVPATPPPVTVTLASLAITGPASVNENGSGTYAATATMSNGTSKAVTATWSENSTATTISAAGVLAAGAVTASQAVVVSASYTEGGVTKNATYNVTVVDVPVTPPPVTVTLASLAISGPASVNENGTGNYTATATMSNGTTKIVTATWSENSTATTISAAGVLTASAVAANQAVVVSASYTEGGVTKSAAYNVTVVDVPPATLSSIALSGPVMVNENSTATYVATATMSDGSAKTVTATWSENTTFTTISTAGVLTASAVTANQTVTVSASYTEGGVSKTATYAVTVVDVPSPTDDNDGDGMPNGFEQTYGFNIYDSSDAGLDPDGDALHNLNEYLSGTDPKNPDTDGDGVWDGADFLPHDQARPAINNKGEYSYGIWFLDNGDRKWNKPSDFIIETFGTPEMLPVVGDWDGDGYDDLGTYIDGTWYIDNGNDKWDAGIDKVYSFGTPTMLPVTGDWNGDGKTEIGAYENGIWYLDANGNGKWDGVGVDIQGNFGTSQMLPVTGDWNDDGKTEIGAYHQGIWYLDNNGNYKWDGINEKGDRTASFGDAAMLPVTADLNGDGRLEHGTYIDGTWYFDTNNNRKWDAGIDLIIKGFGFNGTLPVIGDWNNDNRSELGVWN